MIPRNFERDELIHELWLHGYTIDEISSQTGIPRSSVGYYVSKFNKSKNGNNPRSKPPIKSKRLDKITRILLKIQWSESALTWGRLMNEGKYQDAKNMMESILLYNRLNKELMQDIDAGEEITLEETIGGMIWYILQSKTKSKEEMTADITDILKRHSPKQNNQSPK